MTTVYVRHNVAKVQAEILRLISVMLRQGRLERWGHKHVKLPETDERFKAWRALVTKPLDLPDAKL